MNTIQNDVTNETMLGLSAAVEAMAIADGWRPTEDTARRWIREGVLGPNGVRIFLEAWRFGRRIVTSREAINRFATRLAEANIAPETREAATAGV